MQEVLNSYKFSKQNFLKDQSLPTTFEFAENQHQYSLSSMKIPKKICLHRLKQIVGSSPSGVKPTTIKLGFVASPLSTQHLGARTKIGWLGISIPVMCQSVVTCLSTDCCFIEQATNHTSNKHQTPKTVGRWLAYLSPV